MVLWAASEGRRPVEPSTERPVPCVHRDTTHFPFGWDREFTAEHQQKRGTSRSLNKQRSEREKECCHKVESAERAGNESEAMDLVQAGVSSSLMHWSR